MPHRPRRLLSPLAPLFALLLGAAPTAAAAPPPPAALYPVAPVDVDDDDGDGVRDAAAIRLAAENFVDLEEVREIGRGGRPQVDLSDARGALRLVAGGGVVEPARLAGRGAGPVHVQGLKPGRARVRVGDKSLVFRFVEARFVDAAGRPVDAAISGVPLARTPPSRAPGVASPAPAGEGVRVLLVGDDEDLPPSLALASIDGAGRVVDALPALELGRAACPEDVGPGLSCRATAPVRPVFDEVDRAHPLATERSLQAELGGALVVRAQRRKLAAVRVVGPRDADVGPIDRLRAQLRVLLVRERPQGAPPFGADDRTALELVRRQVRQSNALWGQCGISFGPPDELDMRLVDPPGPHMVAVGCDAGLPASGGALRARVDGKEVRSELRPGDEPREAARHFARALEAAGFVARVSDNARTGPAALPTSDVLVRRRDGARAVVEAPEGGGPLSSDATLKACVGSVDLRDGLQHFTDVDAVAGTLEERALLKAFDDADPRTIEVLFVPSFATGGRIGESFIRGDRSSLRNMLIEDRAGVRADRFSFALAHELGHVLLDVPGHTDDYGVDTPTRLMDSDAADPSPFGPRRLGLDECARAVRQSGPLAPVPVLQRWPLAKLALPKALLR
ncbi:MAG TPA: hypothetical protein VFS43_44160 [Polyangiaceae bacterium]|nr:hypothetical protein [Polyangiaceae bacterium]